MNGLDRILCHVARIAKRVARRLTTAENRSHLERLKACGTNVGIWGPVFITGHDNITIGDNVHIGGGAFIRGEGGLTIGDNTHISRNLLLYTRNHRYEGERIPYDDQQVAKPVTIGRNVWVGMNVAIAPGTRIGDGAIIAMGTVVAGEVPPMSIVGSEKWRVLGWRDERRYQSLDDEKAYAGPNGHLYRSDDVEILQR